MVCNCFPISPSTLLKIIVHFSLNCRLKQDLVTWVLLHLYLLEWLKKINKFNDPERIIFLGLRKIFNGLQKNNFFCRRYFYVYLRDTYINKSLFKRKLWKFKENHSPVAEPNCCCFCNGWSRAFDCGFNDIGTGGDTLNNKFGFGGSLDGSASSFTSGGPSIGSIKKINWNKNNKIQIKVKIIVYWSGCKKPNWDMKLKFLISTLTYITS